MENRKMIIDKVLTVIDELGGCDNVDFRGSFPVETTLDQAGREILLIAPVGAIDRCKSFKTFAHIVRVDGTGEVELPDDFVRMVSFRMRGWHRTVYETIATTSKKYARQFHRATRGGVAKPIVALCGGSVQYFSVTMDTAHVIEEANYVDYTKVDELYPAKLFDALVWLAAAKTLKVMSEYEASRTAMDEYERIINNLLVRYGR